MRYGGAGRWLTVRTWSARPAARRKRWSKTMESMKDSIRILPFSRVSTSATACRSASSGASAEISASARSCGVRAAQAGKARSAAATADVACLALAAAA